MLKRDQLLLENVQRRATKLVPSLKNYSYGDRLWILNLPSLYYRRARGDMIETLEISARTVSCQPDASTERYKHHHKRTLYEAEEGEAFQAPAKKLFQTSRGEPLEHADRKHCNFTIRKYFQKPT